jgi:phosphatidylcholine synthase
MKAAAAAIHALTASGVLAGFEALLASFEHRWERAFIWLAVALLIDGIDGPLARHFQVKAHLPRFSGERLDLIVDYLTYVLVPAVMISEGGLMPPRLGILAAFIILMTSLFHFCDEHSKTPDGFFVGFPAIWNVVAFFLFVMPVPPPWVFSIVVFLGLLTFVPLKWVHPIRVRRWRPVTIAVLVVWSVASIVAIAEGFPASSINQAILGVSSLYLLGCGLARSFIGEE